MRSGAELRSRMVSVTAPLGALNKSDDRTTANLEKLLVWSRIDDAAELTPRQLSLERSSWYGPETLSAEPTQRVDRLLAELDPAQPAEFRVFRREAPLNAPALDLTTPAWGRGGGIAHSELDLIAENRFARALPCRKLSWEGLINLTAAKIAGDPRFLRWAGSAFHFSAFENRLSYRGLFEVIIRRVDALKLESQFSAIHLVRLGAHDIVHVVHLIEFEIFEKG